MLFYSFFSFYAYFLSIFLFIDHNYTFHHQVYLSLKKIRCQVEVLLNQKHSILIDDPLHNKLTSLEERWNSIEKLLPSSVCWFLNVL